MTTPPKLQQQFARPRRWLTLVVAIACKMLLMSSGIAQDTLPAYQPPVGDLTGQEGAWENWRVENASLQRRVLRLVPKSEAKPALSVQLIPNEFDRKEGNAAIFYLQAMGFLEQTYAQRAKYDFEQESRKAATDAGKEPDDAPPHSWRATRPENLPIDEVKKYLQLTSFQPHYLAEAVQRKDCDFDRRIREVENPVMYLLPEIQMLRELARLQSLRFLLAIAEDRSEDAIAVLGQQLALGAHMSQEPFLVSNLVGIACAGIGMADAYYLSEHTNSPNLYWAIAALPQPLVDSRASLAYEREFLFEQFKQLREVNETPLPDAYWSRFLESFAESMSGIADESDTLQQFGKSGLTAMVAAGVPGAKRFLLEVESMPIDKINELPSTQVFFLAVRRHYERARDELMKLQYVPEWKRSAIGKQTNELSQEEVNKFGMITTLSRLVLPATQAMMTAQTRLQQQLAMFQTVESIRHHLATKGNKLPNSLEELELPAPVDPISGMPFDYIRHQEGATLSGSALPGIRYQIELRPAT